MPTVDLILAEAERWALVVSATNTVRYTSTDDDQYNAILADAVASGSPFSPTINESAQVTASDGLGDIVYVT